MEDLPVWYAVARDAALIIAGIGIAVYLAVDHNGDPTLVAMAMALIGAGSYGRGHANGKDGS